MKTKTLSLEELHKRDAYWRATNYLQDVIDRLPFLGSKGAYLKQMMQDKRIEHKQYIDKYCEDVAEIRNWKWSQKRMEKKNNTHASIAMHCRSMDFGNALNRLSPSQSQRRT